MRWSKAAITGGTSLAAAATLNALAARGVAPLENELGGTEEWFTWRSHRIAYTRHGSGRPLLLLHGIHAGAWSYEWRHVVAPLAESHTVFAIDLLGFGRSDRPAIKYTPGLYHSLVTDFTSRVIGAPTVLVASALSAAHAVQLAARDAERWPALVLSVPTGIVQQREQSTFLGETLRLIVESPILGTTMYNALVTRAALRQSLEPLYYRRALVDADLVGAYYASSHQPGAKHVLASLVAGHLNADVRQALRRLQQPTLVVWGRQARLTPVEQAHSFRVLKPDVHLELFDRCGDLPHDEQGATFASTTLDFLAEREKPRVLPFRGKRAG